MLLAIDLGNTHTVFGVNPGSGWLHTWRRSTNPASTEDELAAWLGELCALSGLDFKVDQVVCASVVPQANDAIERLCREWFRVEPVFVKHSPKLGIEVRYEPPTAVGADRLANALGALAKFSPPIIVVDFGTATTFDAISADGAYVGGAILPGVDVSTQALVTHTAKLPQIEFRAPERAIGTTTVGSLQSGIVLGYAGAIDTLARRISAELGGAKVISTGGLGGLFLGICETIESHEPDLTLDGLAIALERLTR